MGKRGENRLWREVESHALGRETERIHTEHVMSIWRLYSVDGLSMTDIAAVYGTTVVSVHRIIKRVQRYTIGKGNTADERYCARAEAHGEVLRMLTEKRKRGYEVIARATGTTVSKVREIAKRNKLER